MIMRSFYILIISIFLSGCVQNKSHQISVDAIPPQEKHIILMHPTVNNVRTFEYLVNNNIPPLPKGYTAIGVYHSLEKFDYSKTEDYLQKNGITNISLVKIDAQISPKNLYGQNPCSDMFKKLFENSNGVIFFGGPDVPPSCYGEQTNLLTIITDPYRHYMELSFLFHLLGGNQDTTFTPLLSSRPDYPILGICLGMQSINIATGGTLYQDIPTELYNLKTVEDVIAVDPNQQHRNYLSNYGTDDDLMWGSFHQVNFTSSAFIVPNINGQNPYVLSSHHQCIKKLGKNLIVVAQSMDGKIIESVTHAKYPNVFGVQFHPEAVEIYNSAEKLKMIPNQPATSTYLELYKGEKGENFHKAFWKEFAGRFK